jgi:hypothetical protein
MDEPLDTPWDKRFDRALREHFATEPEPADGGFCLRVLATLPQRAAVRAGRSASWPLWLTCARWTALSWAAVGAAMLMTPGSTAPEPAHPLAEQLAAACLIGLMVWWSLPSRWSSG